MTTLKILALKEIRHCFKALRFYLLVRFVSVLGKFLEMPYNGMSKLTEYSMTDTQ
jgi:hypothetical protein